MSKKRGLSLEEKRTRMLEVFYEKKDVFQLKELEKIGPQEKGVVSQSVKEVVQSLVDDGFVESERIGTSVYFWSFPSKATQSRKRKLEQLETQETELGEKANEIVQEAKRAKLSRNETPEREEMIATIRKLEEEQKQLKKVLEQYRDSDPDAIAQERQDIKDFTQHANRWTENVFTFQTWLRNKFSMSESEIKKSFGIPEELDYLEEEI
ncbi:meiotic nuclear division protein 1 homolog [Folsomia candida]|uniref:Meiotic nuclear division protein 1 homolog n=1 Tax=Folsomia candida TaxID=158441 RepID=A0A226ETQ9_FOLCA|nr:meiotic nuclear division protein 1 homolog [Folsomia candida]XP_035704002.1 meiotic nuclear division protein 1 homolog [Folsomia candida]XP_035704003.1 meiotic nuclear division protein 1 homolog [Folsomia candida]XP_035704004.1 meiotic nuclear division protein 1 homolog [Folsomia candida]OXA60993.1 Meiotic nuclear division protein 1 [Folsomia candida]